MKPPIPTLILRAKALLVSTLLVSLAGAAMPVHAAASGCTITANAQGLMVDAAFSPVSRVAIPNTLTASVPFEAKCTAVDNSPGGYRWVLTLRTLSFTMVSGTTPASKLTAVGRQFTATPATLEIQQSQGSAGPARVQGVAVAQLSNLNVGLSAGRYLLSQLIDISEETCKWTGNHWTCKSNGTALRQYRANYTLDISDPQPPAGAGTGAGPRKGIKPSPWTVRGHAVKCRCEPYL